MRFGKKAPGKADQKKMGELRTGITQELAELTALSSAERDDKRQDTLHMIKHYLDMSDKVEERRGKLYTYALQMLAVWMAAVVVLIGFNYDSSVDIPDGLFVLLLTLVVPQIVFSLWTALNYHRQTEFRYPFLKGDASEHGNTWKWFYYGNPHVGDISTAALRPSHDFADTIEPFLQSYRWFIHQYSHEASDSALIINIQQLHLLQVHNYYKNKFLLRLTKIQKVSLYALPVGAIVGSLVWLLFL